MGSRTYPVGHLVTKLVCYMMIQKWHISEIGHDDDGDDPEGVLRVSSDGDDQMGAKIETQKNP